MTTVLESLRGINAYPIPSRTVTDTALRRGLDVQSQATMEVLSSSAYRLATADLLMWLAKSPDVTQGGISYSFTDEQRDLLIRDADKVYKSEGETVSGGTAIFGYKGSRL